MPALGSSKLGLELCVLVWLWELSWPHSIILGTEYFGLGGTAEDRG